MKTIKFFIAAIAALVFITNINAQAPVLKTEKTKVWGNCESCKARIEKTLKIDAIFKVEWNIDSKILTVTYDTKKTSLDEIEKKVAAVGHDTEKYKADDKVYAKLPDCCKYR